MAEEQSAETDTTKEVSGDAKGRGKFWLILTLLVLVQIVLTAGGFYFLSKSNAAGKEEEHSADEAHEPEAEAAEEEVVEEELEEGEEILGAIFPLELFIVNLQDTGYLRIEVQLMFEEREIPRKLYPRIPIIRDAIISILTQKSREQILSLKGKSVLREDIKTVVNEKLRSTVVKSVLLTQYVVQ